MNEQELGKVIRGDDYFTMTPEREAHLKSIQDTFCEQVKEKYLRGQSLHGGNLYEKEGMLDMALEEVLDLYVYLITLKQNVLRKDQK